jgi:hypothetical protein
MNMLSAIMWTLKVVDTKPTVFIIQHKQGYTTTTNPFRAMMFQSRETCETMRVHVLHFHPEIVQLKVQIDDLETES